MAFSPRVRHSPAAPRVSADAEHLDAAGRLPLADVLRGVAVLGMLVAYTMWNLGVAPADTWSAADRAIDAAVETFADAKALTLFTFLFGLGIAHSWWRLEADGYDVVAAHVRAMLFLFVVGLAHAVLLRNGDILAPLAILGLVMLPMRGWSTRRILGVAAVLAVLQYAVQITLHASGVTLPPRPLGGLPDNSWRHYLTDNFEWVRYWYRTNPLLAWPRLLAMMLVGVAADRARILPRLAAERRLALRTLGVALLVAVASRVAVLSLRAHGDPAHATLARSIVASQTYWISAWSLAVVYVAALALLCQRPAWMARLAWLRAVGRLSFTSYLLQAVVVVPVCIAAGLFDAVTPTRGALLALGVAAITIPCSGWWLRRFAHGPMEWAWRAATRGAGPRLSGVPEDAPAAR